MSAEAPPSSHSKKVGGDKAVAGSGTATAISRSSASVPSGLIGQARGTGGLIPSMMPTSKPLVAPPIGFGSMPPPPPPSSGSHGQPMPPHNMMMPPGMMFPPMPPGMTFPSGIRPPPPPPPPS